MRTYFALIYAFLSTSFWIPPGFCQQQTVVVPNPVAANQPFTVTCEANRVPSVLSGATSIYSLAIYRNVSGKDAQVAVYGFFGPTGVNLTQSFIPPGRNWTIHFSGYTDGFGSVSNNMNTMKVVLVVWDTRCDDAGIYHCDVIYHPPGVSLPLTADFFVNLKTTAGMGQIELSVTPPTDYNTNQYKTGDNITFTCTVRGQSSLRIGWRLYVSEQVANIQSDAVESLSTVTPIGTGNGGCAEYTIQGTLSLQLRDYNKEETYACVVTDSSNSSSELGMETTNITIGTTESNLQKLNPIANVNDVLEAETFTITCDASRVTIPQSEDHPTSISELIIEARLGSSQKFVKLAQYSACGPQGRLQYQNALPGRDLTFNFTGSNSGQNNSLTMRVEIHVRDPSYTDAGSFRCKVRYFSSLGGVDEVSHEHTLTAGVPIPIVSKDNAINNGSMKITCDARRVVLSDPEVNLATVGALMIEARYGTSQTFTKIAEYLACGPQENLHFQDPPAGSDWDFTFSGSNNGTHNRHTMKIEVLIPEGSCNVTVTYRCSAMFYAINEGTVWLHQDQDLTVTC